MTATVRNIHDRPLPSVDGRPPPHDLDAEASVLCAVLVDGLKLGVVGFLEPEHFYAEAHRRVFEACRALEAASTPIDAVTVARWLSNAGRLEQVGGRAYLTDILNSSPVIANVEHHARIVHDAWRLRRLIDICRKRMALAYVGVGDAEAFVGETMGEIEEVARATSRSAQDSNLEAVKRIVKTIAETRAQDGVTGIATRIRGYDLLTAGLHGRHLTVIGARPGIGKTALGYQIACAAADQGVGVLFFSGEMSRDELLMRGLASEARIDGDLLRRGAITPKGWADLHPAANRIASLRVVVEDAPGLNVREIIARAWQAIHRAALGKWSIGLFVVDYLQLVQPIPEFEGKDTRHQINETTRQLKKFAREAGLPVIALAQLNRELEKGTSKIRWPRASDLAECGGIERHADNIALLHREAHIDQGREVFDDASEAILILAKQRGGKPGVVRLNFDGGTTTFSDRVSNYEDERHGT